MRVIEFINLRNIGPFTFIAHSQGGMVAAHIMTYYHTDLYTNLFGNC